LGLIEEQVNFREYAMDISAHQLVGNELSFGVQYRLAYARLKRSFPEYQGVGYGGVDDNSNWQGWLHTLSLTGLYRHPCGIFAETPPCSSLRTEAGRPPCPEKWSGSQSLHWIPVSRQKAEISVGVLNLLDNDYQLDPINRTLNNLGRGHFLRDSSAQFLSAPVKESTRHLT
jgi:hypothetical protein